MFFELTTSTNKKISIDLEQIESIVDLNNYGHRAEQTVIKTKTGAKYTVQESYREIMSKLQSKEAHHV